MSEKPGVARRVLVWIGVAALIDIFVIVGIIRACVR